MRLASKTAACSKSKAGTMSTRFSFSVLPPMHCSLNSTRRFLVSHATSCGSIQQKYTPEKCSCASSSNSSLAIRCGISKRELLLLGVASSMPLSFPESGVLAAEENIKMAEFIDNTNAYSYLYPLELPSKKFTFKWVESRKPERYSSAAPLSPDARLRMVSERVDFFDNVIISVTIGPPNFQVMKSKDKKTWTANEVADSVLSDKAALRISSTQRRSESSVLNAREGDIADEPYWYCEYLIRKSPTKLAQDSNLYRHYVASIAERDGYLYSLSASTLSNKWKKMGPYLEKVVESFRLLDPTSEYVPPSKDPWRFW